MRGAAVAGAFLVAISAAGSALADGDPVAAQVLFDAGKKLMAEKEYAAACDKFAESQRLDPAIGTDYALADCYERAGKLARAWVTFLDVVAAARKENRADRVQYAQKRADAIAPRLSRIVVTLSADARAAGATASRDGEPLTDAQLGLAIPVDPGEHRVAASARGRADWTTTVDARAEGQTFRVEVPKLADAGAAAAAPVTTAAPLAALPPGEPPPAGGGWGWQRVAAVTAGGIGVVGLGVGAFFGAQAFSKHSDGSQHCTGNVCDPTGLQLMSDGKNAGNVSTVATAAGAVLAAGGVVLWITAPRPRSSTAASVRAAPLVGQGFGGVTIAGGW
jgi:serine/threonine-protein kinase